MKKNEPVVLKANQDNNYTIRHNLKHLKKKVLYVHFEHQGKYHTQYLFIPPPASDFDVQFFPEGGLLLTGIDNQVAFKALNSNGFGEAIKGVIVDETGTVVTTFRSEHLGMGAFLINPRPGKRYMAVCENNSGETKRFDLPDLMDKGIKIQVADRGENLYVSVMSTGAAVLDSLYLAVHSRGNMIYCELWDISNEYIILSKENMPAGVIHFILIDENMLPVSERLVFNRNTKELAQSVVEFNKEVYSKRDLVETGWTFSDEAVEQFTGNFSVTVTGDEVKWDRLGSNILTSLLLESDLKGNIENPGFYFGEESRELSRKRDLLMLTQGWRRYEVADILSGKWENYKGEPNRDEYITGIVKGNGFNKKPVKNFTVKLTSLDPFYFEQTQTDESGRYYFPAHAIPDSISFVIQAGTQKDNQKVVVVNDDYSFPEVNNPILSSYANRKSFNKPEELDFLSVENEKEQEEILRDYMRQAEMKYTFENGMRVVHLKEIEVKAPFLSKDYAKGRISLMSTFVTSEELKVFGASKMFDVLNTLPSVMAVQNNKKGQNGEDDITIFVRNGIPLLLIDGIISSPDQLNAIPSSDIETLEILKGVDSFMYGSLANGGAIVVTTKYRSDYKPEEIELTNLLHIRPLGFQIKKEFYAPSYTIIDPTAITQPDLRTTIHWEPVVKINEKGQAGILFYTSDSSGTYTVIIEGTAHDGKIIYRVDQIRVN